MEEVREEEYKKFLLWLDNNYPEANLTHYQIALAKVHFDNFALMSSPVACGKSYLHKFIKEYEENQLCGFLKPLRDYWTENYPQFPLNDLQLDEILDVCRDILRPKKGG